VSGDTLDSISAKYNISKKHLISQNNLRYPYKLELGQKLVYSKIETKTKILYKDEDQTVKSMLDQSEEVYEIDDEFKKELDKEIQDSREEFVRQSINSPISDNAVDTIKQKQSKNENSAIDMRKMLQARIDKNSILFPINNGKIDKSLPFSQKHGKRKDGVFVLSTGYVLAPYDGLVMFVENGNNVVYIKKDIGNVSWIVTYSNLAEVFVKKGDVVKQGDRVGYSAGSIFLRIWDGSKYIDPEKIEYIR